MANIWPNGIPDGIREMLKEELLNKKHNPDLFLNSYMTQIKKKRESLEMGMAAAQTRYEAGTMAMSRIDPHMREHMIAILRHEYSEIYDHSHYHREFEHNFERMINQGCPVEEAVHRTAQRMIERDPDLRRERIGKKHTAGRGQANSYRGSITDYGMSRSQHEIEMRSAREVARIRQMQMAQEPIVQMSDHDLNSYAMGLVPAGRKAEPKKKKLTILEQLQADVDVWLKDSLKLTHLENIKL